MPLDPKIERRDGAAIDFVAGAIAFSTGVAIVPNVLSHCDDIAMMLNFIILV
ncbi:MAG: hypothetical protein VKJ24_13765 [Synechococcales bacterium]|nr:hypothetical protein [Synechococcales bacterium]